jgi:fumarylacetoacetate (FAA) hydrolase
VRLCTFTSRTPPTGPARPGRVERDRVIPLAAPSLQAYLAAGAEAREEPALPLSEVRLNAPVLRPPSVRDFYAFEQHVATARRLRGQDVPQEWYEIPVFYFSNPGAIAGPDEPIAYPDGTQKLDYELEVAAVIGYDGAIAGFTIMNDWSARDLQAQEVRVGLGPAKGKDFATSLGPVLVTADEFDGRAAEMLARVNGEVRSRGNLRDLYWSWEQLHARAALNTRLEPGDVLGSGTVGTGCILEHDDGRWLRPGDVVELEVEGIGVLRNEIVDPRR